MIHAIARGTTVLAGRATQGREARHTMDRVVRLILAPEVPAMTDQGGRNILAPEVMLMMVLVVPDTPGREVLRTEALEVQHMPGRAALVTQGLVGHVIRALAVRELTAHGNVASNFDKKSRVMLTHI